MSKRKDTEEFILNYIAKVVTGDENISLYRDLFKSMTNEQFDKFMVDLRDKKTTLGVIIPNGSKTIKVSIENNLKLAKELNFDFFQHLQVSANGNIPAYTTPNKYMVMRLPIRRAAQLLSKKISIPEDSKSIDSLTGQVTGKSKASKLTLPEVQILLGLGLNDSIKELMKIRGGDLGASNAHDAMLYKQGYATQAEIEKYSTKVVSTKTLKSYLNGMHIRSTL